LFPQEPRTRQATTNKAIAARTLLKPGTPNSVRDKDLDARKRDYNRAILEPFPAGSLSPT
jgi:hypothetical protein